MSKDINWMTWMRNIATAKLKQKRPKICSPALSVERFFLVHQVLVIICSFTLEKSHWAVIGRIINTWKFIQTRGLMRVLLVDRDFHGCVIINGIRKCIAVWEIMWVWSVGRASLLMSIWNATRGFILEKDLSSAHIVKSVSHSQEAWQHMSGCIPERSHSTAHHVARVSIGYML